MSQTSNEEKNLDKLLAELEKDKISEDESIPKKEDKNPYKDKKNDEQHDYEYSDNLDEPDTEW